MGLVDVIWLMNHSKLKPTIVAISTSFEQFHHILSQN